MKRAMINHRDSTERRLHTRGKHRSCSRQDSKGLGYLFYRYRNSMEACFGMPRFKDDRHCHASKRCQNYFSIIYSITATENLAQHRARQHGSAGSGMQAAPPPGPGLWKGKRSPSMASNTPAANVSAGTSIEAWAASMSNTRPQIKPALDSFP